MQRKTSCLTMCGLLVLAWDPPVPHSEAGKALAPPRVIVLKGQPNLKASLSPILPAEFAKAAKARPNGLSAAEKRSILISGGDGILPKPPKLKLGTTLATKLKLTPRQLYVAGVGWLNLGGAAVYAPEGNYVFFLTSANLYGPGSKQVEFVFKSAVAGKRYLVEFGIHSGAPNPEYSLFSPYGMQQIRNPHPSISIVFEAYDTQVHVFALTGSQPWFFDFCEVTTLD